MSCPKKRVLICGEFSLLSSGYARMSYAILSHLAATGKYELAELANYCWPMDLLAQKDQKTLQALQSKCNWKVYPVMPYEDEQNIYNSDPMNQFGAYRFNDVLLSFKPHIIISWLDIWMCTHLFRSPFRDFYKLILMPAIDGSPQQNDWVDIYKQSDKLVTYSDWARDLLKDFDIEAETNSPGVDITTFFPSHKKINCNSAGRTDNDSQMIVIGTVMRNQKRKLFPDLIRAFEKLIYYCKEKGNNKLADNLYLYLHTSYPDIGWPLEALICQSKIGHRILFTYICREPNCNSVFPSLWMGARTNCPSCHKFSAVLPNTQNSVPDEVLANIINTFDLYSQHASLEGFGIPLIESAACAVPAMATDYSAMEDVVRKVRGIPLKVSRYYKEAETGRDFALPDDESFVEEAYKFLNLPESLRKKRGFDARKACEKHYSWKRACKQWEDIIDKMETRDEWNSSPRLINADLTYLNDPNIQKLSPNQFIELSKKKILGNILDRENYRFYQYLKQLNYNTALQPVGGTSCLHDMTFLSLRQNLTTYDGKKLVEEFVKISNEWNNWEKIRCKMIPYNEPKFVQNSKKELMIGGTPSWFKDWERDFIILAFPLFRNTEIAKILKRKSNAIVQFGSYNGLIKRDVVTPGDTFGLLTVLDKFKISSKKFRKYWLCKCKCTNEKYILQDSLIAGRTISCGCYSQHRKTKFDTENVPRWYWKDVYRKAIVRGMPCNITVQDLENLFIKQNGKCALTNLDIKIKWGNRKESREKCNASVDRIDSTKGYSIDNIQLLHVDANIMKGMYTQQHFINIAHLIAKNTKYIEDTNLINNFAKYCQIGKVERFNKNMDFGE